MGLYRGAPIILLVLVHERRDVWFGGTDRWGIPIEESKERASERGTTTPPLERHNTRRTIKFYLYQRGFTVVAFLKLSKLELLKRIHQQREFNLQGPSVVHLFATNRVRPCTPCELIVSCAEILGQRFLTTYSLVSSDFSF